MGQSAKSFFESFSHQYLLTEKEKYLFQKKYDHTYLVVKYTEKLLDTLGWNFKKRDLAITIAIFHDLGRFVQAKQFHRFQDAADSFDHAEESVNILKNQDWFKKNNISKEAEEIICFAIYYHNKLTLPKDETGKMEFAKLIRDADKLANLKSISCKENVEKSSIEKSILPENLELYFHNQCIPKKNQVSALDHLLMQICFLYDFNYKVSVLFCFQEHLLEPYFTLLKENIDESLYFEMRKHFEKYVTTILDEKSF